MLQASFTVRLGNSIGVDDDEAKKALLPKADVNQENPKGFYIYAHFDLKGNVFYIGKGNHRRAWSKDRHDLWVRYVQKHLNGQFEVRILADNLTSEAAEELEAELTPQFGDSLVNWVNMGRSFDYEVWGQRRKLGEAIRALIQKAKNEEKENLTLAAELYAKAIEDTRAYALMTDEKGLFGQLRAEEVAEVGIHGNLNALDRLALCLIKLKRPRDAAESAASYFALYRRDLQYKASQRIQKRIEKALARMQ